MDPNNDLKMMREAIRLSALSLENPAFGPFGAVIAIGAEIIGTGHNRVLADSDPTAHAEIMAIRDACRKSGSHVLEGATIYTSCEPCPMCLGAIYWAHIGFIYYAGTQFDAAKIGFSDEHIYKEFELPIAKRQIEMRQIMSIEAAEVFHTWVEMPGRTLY